MPIRRTVVDANDAAAVGPLVRGVRIRMVVAIALGAFATWGVGALPISPAGAALALAPALGAAVGIAVLGAWSLPRRAPADGLRRADLIPRGPGGLGARWRFILPGGLTVVLVLLLVATGLTASPIDGPFSHEFLAIIPQGTDTAGPYPDWSYGVYILGGTLVLIVAMLFALHRVATSPRIGEPDSLSIDEALSRTLSRFIALSTMAVVVLYLGAISLTAGAAARSAASWSIVRPAYVLSVCGRKIPCSFTSTPANLVSGVAQPTFTWGSVVAIIGIVLIGLSFVITLLALSNLIIRWTVEAPAEREAVDA